MKEPREQSQNKTVMQARLITLLVAALERYPEPVWKQLLDGLLLGFESGAATQESTLPPSPTTRELRETPTYDVVPWYRANRDLLLAERDVLRRLLKPVPGRREFFFQNVRLGLLEAQGLLDAGESVVLRIVIRYPAGYPNDSPTAYLMKRPAPGHGASAVQGRLIRVPDPNRRWAPGDNAGTVIARVVEWIWQVGRITPLSHCEGNVDWGHALG